MADNTDRLEDPVVRDAVKVALLLNNVSNTSDANKPVSTLQAAADTAVQAFAIQRANHTGTQAHTTITGLGSAATTASTDYATAAQGTLATGALQRSGGTLTGTVISSNVITTTGNMAHITTQGASAQITTSGNAGYIYTSGNNGYIYTEGTNAKIYTYGVDAPIYTQGANAYIQTADKFQIATSGGTYKTKIGNVTPTVADQTINFPDTAGAGGTIALTSNSGFTDERVPTAAGLTSKFSTNKVTIIDADKLTILDSAASDAPKHSLASAVWTYLQTKFAAATSKTTPIDADSFNIVDSADSNAAKRVTGTNLKAYLKTYLDTLYVALTGNQTIAGNKTLSGQTELTGQAATNGTSAMNRDLTLELLGSPKWYIMREEWDIAQGWNAETVAGSGGWGNEYNTLGYSSVILTTGSTSASAIGVYRAFNSNLSPYLLQPWVWLDRSRITSITDTIVRIGFFSGSTFVAGFEFNSATSANWRYYDLGTGAFTDTGVAAVADTWVNFKMRSNGNNNQIVWSVNGGAETTRINAYDYLLNFGNYITNSAAAEKKLIKDFTSFIGYANR